MRKKQKNRWLKKRFKNEVFTDLCKKDIPIYGRPRHHLSSAYEAIDWIVENFDLLPKNVTIPQKNDLEFGISK